MEQVYRRLNNLPAISAEDDARRDARGVSGRLSKGWAREAAFESLLHDLMRASRKHKAINLFRVHDAA